MEGAAGEERERPGSGRGECHYALLEFEKPVTCLPDSIVIGSRLDTDVHIHLLTLFVLLATTSPPVLCSIWSNTHSEGGLVNWPPIFSLSKL